MSEINDRPSAAGADTEERQLRLRLKRQTALADLARQAVCGDDLPALLRAGAALLDRQLGLPLVELLEPDAVDTPCESPIVVDDLARERRLTAALLRERGAVSGLFAAIAGAHGRHGVLAAFSEQSRAFPADEVDFFGAVGGILAGAIDRRRREEALAGRLEQRGRLLELLRFGSEITLSTADAESAATAIVAHVRDMLRWPAARLCLAGSRSDEDDPERAAVFCQPFGNELDDSLWGRLADVPGAPGAPWDVPRFRTALAAGMPLWVSADSPLGADLPAGFASACVVPVQAGGETLGVLELFSQRPREADDDQLELLAQVGAKLSQVIERMRAQERALRQFAEVAHLDRAASLSELAGNLAHEVNQPLAALVGYAGGALLMLERGVADEAKLRRALEQISAQAKRAGEVVQNLRQFLRREQAGQHELDIAGVARQAARLIESRARAAGVKLELDLPDGLPPLFGDPDQLMQVIINLTVNGIEAMSDRRPGRQMLISARRHESQIELVVRDAGCALPDELLPRLFEPFFTTKRRGLGMGLAISRSIAEFHGGRLSGEKNVDGGMSFRLRLPFARGAV